MPRDGENDDKKPDDAAPAVAQTAQTSSIEETPAAAATTPAAAATHPTPPPPPAAALRRPRGKGIRYALIGIVALTAVIFAAREVMLRMTHVYEYDARVVTDHITIGSRVEGTLIELNVENGQTVAAGELIAQIDDRVQRFELDALKAALQALRTERGGYAARTNMVTKQTDSRYRTRLTSIRATRARRSALQAELTLAKQDLARFQNLFERRVIPRNRLDRALSEVARLTSDVRRADADIASSRGEAAEAEADKGELTVIEQELASLEYKEAQLGAQIARQEVLIQQRAIRAPKAGVIDRVFVENGEFIGEGRRMMMLHDPEGIWVEANIKETEIRRLQPGQRVAIAVDAYPDDTFVGRVSRIGTAATSRFALLPTPNPSGNFTKVTQRIPVKILFVERPRTLSPGMMVEVDIAVSEDL
jgi:membrane fusion protein (multidrug efflux system)